MVCRVPASHSPSQHRSPFGMVMTLAMASTLATGLSLGVPTDARAQAPTKAQAQAQGQTQAQPQPAAQAPTDGVKLDPTPNPVKQLIPAEDIEQQASREYEQIKQEAIARQTLAPDNDPQLIRLRAIARRLLPETTRWNERAKTWKWEINLIQSKRVNAFCMPGGKVAVYSGLLDQLRLTDDEVAMVLGHEISHALREHARERAAKAEITNLGANVISQLFGFGNLGNMSIGASAHLLTLKYSRNDETEADLIGMDIASRAGFDPRAAVTLWQKMGNMSTGATTTGADFLSTHPSGRTRIAVLEKHLPEVLPLYALTMKMPMEMLPPHVANMPNLTSAPIDSGDDDTQRPLNANDTVPAAEPAGK